MIWCFLILVISILVTQSAGLCRNVGPPCICAPSVAEPVSIICNSPGTLDLVASALQKLGNLTVDRLVIRDTRIEELQADNPLKSLRIRRLSLNGNGMWKIHMDAFDGELESVLEELDLKNNNFGEIPNSGVPKLKNLKRINLSRNRINSLPSRAFFNYSSLLQITRLDLSRNFIGNLGESSPFIGMGSLRDLNLENNFLKSIPTKALEAVRNSLEDLNLGSNGISSFPPQGIDLPRLISLSLEFNDFKTISSRVFQGVPNLLYLYLTGAYKSDKLDPEMFRYIPKLKGLGLGETQILEIPSDAFKYIPGLVRLSLSESAVGTIQPGALQATPKIEAVILHKCQLESVPREMFQGLDQLYSLDLSGNKITTIESESFSGLSSLQHLDLSTNLLSFMSPDVFSQDIFTGEPKSVYLCYNPWDCSERLEELRLWLRERFEVIIDKDSDCVTQCTEPPEAAGSRLRERPPPTTTLPPVTKAPSTTTTTTRRTTTRRTTQPRTVYVTPVTDFPPRRTTTERRNGGNTRPSGLTIFQKMLKSLEALVVEIAERTQRPKQ